MFLLQRNILNKNLSLQLSEATRDNIKKHTKKMYEVNKVDDNKNEVYSMVPFISFFSFLAGYYFFRYTN